MDKINKETCPVCLEAFKDPRTLPCWHVVCLCCILPLTKGQKRAIRCPLCRAACLSENLRKLPKPMCCQICGKFLVKPVRTPSGSTSEQLFCLSCVEGRASVTSAHEAQCGGNKHVEKDMLAVNICQICHRVGVHNTPSCAHSICDQCASKRPSDERCSICHVLDDFLAVQVTIDPFLSLERSPHPVSLQELQNLLRFARNGVEQQPTQRAVPLSENAADLVEAWPDTLEGIFAALLVFLGLVLDFGVGVWLLLPVLIWIAKPCHRPLLVVCDIAYILLFIVSLKYHFQETIFFILLQVSVLAFSFLLNHFLKTHSSILCNVCEAGVMCCVTVCVHCYFSKLSMHLVTAWLFRCLAISRVGTPLYSLTNVVRRLKCTPR